MVKNWSESAGLGDSIFGGFLEENEFRPFIDFLIVIDFGVQGGFCV